MTSTSQHKPIEPGDWFTIVFMLAMAAFCFVFLVNPSLPQNLDLQKQVARYGNEPIDPQQIRLEQDACVLEDVADFLTRRSQPVLTARFLEAARTRCQNPDFRVAMQYRVDQRNAATTLAAQQTADEALRREQLVATRVRF